MNKVSKLVICILFVAPLVLANHYWGVQATSQKVSYEEVAPIFAAHCNQCHGAKKAAAMLRLDSAQAIFKGGISGGALVAGNSKKSLLLARILGEGGNARMPMGSEPLKPEEINIIRQWIDTGITTADIDEAVAHNQSSSAPQHWAYKKLARPALPIVKNAEWVRNPIDNFVLARLEKVGLQPAPEASKETLLRRVYLDLIGLPPSVKEIDDFLADKNPDAYEKIVDRLLASQHYGERWARPWLDLARYADSNGYEKDTPRVMWKFRDWVINALNEDKPFDQFTIEQIAGDMLPNATTEQKIASGFHRNTLLNQEGGVDDEEARFETLIDRVNTTATVWLGTTMGCSQCHNHKYDPFTQKDYYKLMAFFDNHEYYISSFGNSEGWVVEPELEMPTPEQETKRKNIKDEIAALETKIKTVSPAMNAAQSAWEREQIDEVKKWTALDPLDFTASNGTTFTKLEDNSLLANGASPEREEYVVKLKNPLPNVNAIRLEVLPDETLPRGGPGRDPYGNFVLSKLEISANGKTIKPYKAKVDNGTFNEENFLFAPIVEAVNDNPGGWQIDATRDANNKRLPRQLIIQFDPQTKLAANTEITLRLKHFAGGIGQGTGRIRFSVTNSNEPLQSARVPAAMRPVLALSVNKRSEKEQTDLTKLFRDLTPIFATERTRIQDLQKQLKDLKIVSALIMGEKKNYERPSTYFHERGAYLNKTEKVYANTPASLPPLPENAPVNRLGLAYWLVDENNPLTARVAVNRFWEQFFGRGIVLTSEDFGTQGEAPSHPELLDWLAVEFMQPSSQNAVHSSQQNSREPRTANWSMKHMLRLIVTSATYRQSSQINPKSKIQNPKSDDPYNRLLARGPRFRVEAEMIRDLGLSISGLLSEKIGGPSVYPLQPEGIWKNPYSSEKWEISKGEDKYRRSLYTFIRRTSPHPAMMTFDASSREFCTVRRPRTNTPLQSLNLLNDEAAMENARALAKRILQEGGNNLSAQLTYGFRLCTSRQPNGNEISRLQKLYEQELNHYGNDEKAALALNKNAPPQQCSASEFAARIIVANVLLNLDETLTKE